MHRPSRHIAPRRPTAANARGFTLIELSVALAIFGFIMVVMYGILYDNVRLRDQLKAESRLARTGPAILDAIEQDLSRLWISNIEEDAVFYGEPRSLGGDPADRLHFLTTVDTTAARPVDRRSVTADVCETGYVLRRNPDLDDFLELWRRQDYHLDEEPLEGGEYERLHDRITSFRLRYLESLDETAEPLDEWDARERHRMPAAVIVDVSLEVLPRGVADPATGGAAFTQTQTFQRVIPIANTIRSTDLAMRVHPLVPDFVVDGRGGFKGSANSPGEGNAPPPSVPTDGDGDGSGDGPDGSTPSTDDLPGGDGSGSGDPGGTPGDLQDLFDELTGGGG